MTMIPKRTINPPVTLGVSLGDASRYRCRGSTPTPELARSDSPCLPVHGHHILDGSHRVRAHRFESALDHDRDGSEADPAVEKCPHRDLVGGVEHGGGAAPGAACLVSQPETRE